MHESERPLKSSRDIAYARIALLVGLVAVALAGCLTLTGSPVSVAGTNGVPLSAILGELGSGATICQAGGSVPQGTSAVRMSLAARAGPSVVVRLASGGRTIARGERGAGWTSQVVTVSIPRQSRSTSDVTVCATVSRAFQNVVVLGEKPRPSSNALRRGRPAPQIRIEYLRPAGRSWWSSILAVARRMGLGHAFPGTWIVPALVALMLTAFALACWLVLTGLGPPRPAADANPASATTDALPAGARRGAVPRAAWVCAAVACLNAVCWSFITPPFQAPDEPNHYAYVTRLATSGQLPSASESSSFSPQESNALEAVDFSEIRLQPQTQTISTELQQRLLEDQLAEPLSEVGGGVGVASSEPPLYYALEAIPYELGGNVLDRLELMRLLGAVFAGVAALFVVLFLREALPALPWTWTVGGLGVALSPLLGFVSGTLNPDVMLTAVSAALFYAIARGFRRGLTPSLAVLIGAAMAVGLLTKLNFVGLLPGAVLALAILAVRAARASAATGREIGAHARAPAVHAQRSLLLALAIPGVPALAFVARNLLSGARTLGVISSALHLLHGSPWREASYIWQFYLPRLPWMRSDFTGIFPTRDLWFDHVVGLYGWLDTTFPGWVYDLAIVPSALIAALCARTLLARRASLRARAAELAVYGAMALGLLALVGLDSYIGSFEAQRQLYAEPRYLLPLIALPGAVLALAARGAGRRWLPAVGTLLVVAVMAHDLFSQLQVISRYYG